MIPCLRPVRSLGVCHKSNRRLDQSLQRHSGTGFGIDPHHRLCPGFTEEDPAAVAEDELAAVKTHHVIDDLAGKPASSSGVRRRFSRQV